MLKKKNPPQSIGKQPCKAAIHRGGRRDEDEASNTNKVTLPNKHLFPPILHRSTCQICHLRGEPGIATVNKGDSLNMQKANLLCVCPYVRTTDSDLAAGVSQITLGIRTSQCCHICWVILPHVHDRMLHRRLQSLSWTMSSGMGFSPGTSAQWRA